MLYLSDLDGTLLRSDGSLSPFSLETLNRLIDDGLNFSVASARSIVTIREILKGLRLRLPVIEFNGAFLTDFHTGEHLVTHSIPSEHLDPLFSLLERSGITPFLSTFNGKEDCLYYSRITNPGMASYYENRRAARDPRLRPIASLREALKEEVICVTIVDRAPRLEEVRALCVELFGDAVCMHFFEDFYCRGWFWLTVHNRCAAKDQAAARLLAETGLTAEQLVVFGDNTNDLSMLSYAGVSVAVENALSEVKAAANQLIGSNDTDSVVRFIMDHNGHSGKSPRTNNKATEGRRS